MGTMVVNPIELQRGDITEYGVVQAADVATYRALYPTYPDVCFNFLVEPGKWVSLRNIETMELLIERPA